VDAAYAPFLQRYLLIDAELKNDVLRDFPLVRAWAEALMADERVTGAVPDNFEEEFIGNLHRRELYARAFFENTLAAE
jgi:glutathione S-transferase